MNQLERQQQKTRMRITNLIREMEQVIRDVQYWNKNRLDSPSMDCEPERVLLHAAKQCLIAFDADNVKEVQRAIEAMVAIAAKGVDGERSDSIENIGKG